MDRFYELYEAAKDTPTAPRKGEFLGECNRTACTVAPAVAFNRVTHGFYCLGCARKINESWAVSNSKLPEGEQAPLCTVTEA